MTVQPFPYYKLKREKLTEYNKEQRTYKTEVGKHKAEVEKYKATEEKLAEKELAEYEHAKKQATKPFLSRIDYKKFLKPSHWLEAFGQRRFDKNKLRELTNILQRLPKTPPEIISKPNFERVHKAVAPYMSNFLKGQQ